MEKYKDCIVRSVSLASLIMNRYSKNNQNPEAYMIQDLLPWLAAVLGASLSLPLRYLFGRFPESWLQDYDYDPKAANHRPAKRIALFPDTPVLAVSLAVLFFLAFRLNPGYTDKGHILHILLMILPLLPFSLIVISDHLNRIIPDQLVLLTGIFSILGLLADGFEGSLWVPAGGAWYLAPLNRVLGGIIGAALLFGIAFLGSWISGQESMGFGDIKLIFVCGLLSGGFGLIFVFFFAFVAGGIFAVPLFIRKQKRIRAEDKLILTSEDPEKTRRQIEEQKAGIHFADDPDYIAFGPFLAIGTAVFLIFETPVYQYFQSSILPTLGFIF